MQNKKIDIEKVAELAHLELTPEQKERFGKQLMEILAYVEKLNELDTETIEPFRHVLEIATPFRNDKAFPSMSREKVLMNAPDTKNSFFKTPKVKD